jgi:HlyD family secretion protein
MIRTLLELFNLFNLSEKRQLIRLQALIILMSILELIAIASIGPFMALVAKPDIINSSTKLQTIMDQLGTQSHFELLVSLGFVVLSLIILSAIVSLFTHRSLLRFGAKLGADLGTRLFSHYMQKNWLFHTSTNSSLLVSKIAAETNRTTQQIIQPTLIATSKVVLTIFISISIFLLNPIVAIVGLSIFGSAYILVFKFTKKRLLANGERMSNFSAERFLTLSEGFGGIKDTLVLNKQRHFTQQFEHFASGLAYSQSTNQFLSISPRYIMEAVAFCAVISLVLYLINFYNGDLSSILPLISIYALAGFKLMPALQNIFFCLAQIKANIPAFNKIKADLQEQLHNYTQNTIERHISFKQSLEVKNLLFSYPNTEQPTLNNLSFTIKANQSVAFVGSSGSGKSTLIDILLGLIPPQSGQILIDGAELNKENIRSWQENIGYVPQQIFLSDKSIKENIAFGTTADNIDKARLNTAIRLSHIDQFLNNINDGIETKVGERGTQLSGGQQQRIGIARALYHNPSVLIFDEATSALDGITEQGILESIEELSGKKTIIMIAHRLSTVKDCDMIYFMDHGQIIDSGTYNELLKKNRDFKAMAGHKQE